MNEIKLKIITPERTVIDSHFNKILLPGKSGDFQLLYNHENFISRLRMGIISVDIKGSLTPSFVISQAFATFNQDQNMCEVTTEFAVAISEIKILSKSDITKKMDFSTFEPEKQLYQFILLLGEKYLKI